jgi:hypothetical protein
MRGNQKNIAMVVLTFLLMLAVLGCMDTPKEQQPGFAEGLAKVLGYYQQDKHELDSWWEMVALYGAGADFKEGPWQLPGWASEDLPPGSSATAYAGFILGLLAQDEDPWAWQDRHLPAELASLQQRDGSFGGSINYTIWAMLSLDVTGFSYAREEALAYLLGDQKADGGFALTGSMGDPDVTAMALLALNFHRDIPAAEEAVQRSLDFLKSHMLPSGGFASYNAENANSTAIALSALITLGEDYQEGPWLADDGGPLEALLTYQVADGSFSFFQDPLKGDNMATYQALIALGDAAAGTSVFSRLQADGEKYRRESVELLPAEPPRAEPGPGSIPKGTAISLVSNHEEARILYTLDGSDPWEKGLEYTEPLILEEGATLKAVAFVIGMRGSEEASFDYSIKEEKPVAQKPPSGSSEPKPKTPTISVTVRVVGENKTHFSGKVNVPEDKTNALQALLSTGLKVSVRSDGFVQAVAGEANAGVSGWKYKVNNEAPMISASTYSIKEGDTVIWWYADNPNSTGP